MSEQPASRSEACEKALVKSWQNMTPSARRLADFASGFRAAWKAAPLSEQGALSLTYEEVRLLRQWFNYMAETVHPDGQDDALYLRLANVPALPAERNSTG